MIAIGEAPLCRASLAITAALCPEGPNAHASRVADVGAVERGRAELSRLIADRRAVAAAQLDLEQALLLVVPDLLRDGRVDRVAMRRRRPPSQNHLFPPAIDDRDRDHTAVFGIERARDSDNRG